MSESTDSDDGRRTTPSPGATGSSTTISPNFRRTRWSSTSAAAWSAGSTTTAVAATSPPICVALERRLRRRRRRPSRSPTARSTPWSPSSCSSTSPTHARCSASSPVCSSRAARSIDLGPLRGPAATTITTSGGSRPRVSSSSARRPSRAGTVAGLRWDIRGPRLPDLATTWSLVLHRLGSSVGQLAEPLSCDAGHWLRSIATRGRRRPPALHDPRIRPALRRHLVGRRRSGRGADGPASEPVEALEDALGLLVEGDELARRGVRTRQRFDRSGVKVLPHLDHRRGSRSTRDPAQRHQADQRRTPDVGEHRVGDLADLPTESRRRGSGHHWSELAPPPMKASESNRRPANFSTASSSHRELKATPS